MLPPTSLTTPITLSLKHSYSVIAPLYDLVVEKATRPLRLASISEFQSHLSNTSECHHENLLEDDKTCKVLLCGIGSGLDIPHLPLGPDYTGIDLTPNMLKRAEKRNDEHNMLLDQGDVMALPYRSDVFDYVIMHLILAVVPQPQKALQEAQRVLKPGGTIFIADKFLHRNQFAPLRKMLSPVIGLIATQTNVIFEDILDQCPHLTLVSDNPDLARGWFRRIVLQKRELEL
jgi:ubiquinone/menaquinone biosynthesis C-methylase UbiE